MVDGTAQSMTLAALAFVLSGCLDWDPPRDISPDGDSDVDADGDADGDDEFENVCGDDACEVDETAETCPEDCPVECGDGYCTHDEGVESCSEDCPAECGDGLCTHDESWCSCGDCDVCGDGECSFREAGSGSCAGDCPMGAWVRICAGTFAMGSDRSELGHEGGEVRHEVTLAHDFEIQSTEVTQAQFESLMDYNPSHFSHCGTDCPVEQVSWHEAAAYCNALSKNAGLARCYSCTGVAPEFDCSLRAVYTPPYKCPGYRLPTEAEWEYASRAGSKTATYNGDLAADQLECEPPNDVLDPVAWFCGNSEVTYEGAFDCSGWPPGAPTCGTHPIGGRKANSWGVYDTLGNVWEWCHDWNGTYPGSKTTDPWGPGEGLERVFRGGCWDNSAKYLRAALRRNESPGFRFKGLGLRPSRSL